MRVLLSSRNIFSWHSYFSTSFYVVHPLLVLLPFLPPAFPTTLLCFALWLPPSAPQGNLALPCLTPPLCPSMEPCPATLVSVYIMHTSLIPLVCGKWGVMVAFSWVLQFPTRSLTAPRSPSVLLWDLTPPRGGRIGQASVYHLTV